MEDPHSQRIIAQFRDAFDQAQQDIDDIEYATNLVIENYFAMYPLHIPEFQAIIDANDALYLDEDEIPE